MEGPWLQGPSLLIFLPLHNSVRLENITPFYSHYCILHYLYFMFIEQTGERQTSFRKILR